ncbi:glycoside hydrolase superfamily, partial [Obelidium mucronatum]
RLEPPSMQNTMMLGMALDWSYEVPTASVAKMNGWAPALYNAWLDIKPGTWGGLGYDNSSFNWFGSEAGRVGAMLELSLNPQVENITDITPLMMTNFAKMCQFINQFYGVPIFLRWAHEMNGDWYPWGNNPSAFIASFRQFTTIVRQHTNMTAMVWAPNIGITYPFIGGGARPSPLRGGLDFEILDSNRDGVIDNYDDPYTPFYPGDDYVDWVGLSLYYYPSCHNNCPVPAGFFEQLLTGINNPNAPAQNLDAWLQVHNFYQMFAVNRKKPMMLPETGSPWIAAWANAAGATTEVEVKRGWWTQLVSQNTFTKYPMLKLIVQFEEVKPLALDGVAAIQDWRVTNNTVTLTWWNSFINSVKGNLRDAEHMVYSCDGSIAL